MPRIRTAHKFSERQRTGDVLADELVDFKSLLLSPDVLKGLNSSGFERPSPIQLKAIPLGRCGLDLIAQAKSGTGKTCVFSVIALESVLPDSNATQVLILAPTREIAVQIKDVISAIGSEMKNLVCQVFIGGLPVDEDKKMLRKPCHIAVGTPGRVKYLIENHFLKTESVRLFILDEADKLLEDNFQEQINWIFSSLPSNKQMMAFSATYPEYLAKHLTKYMREPTFVRLNATDPSLQGIKQFYRMVPFHPLPHKTFHEKVSELLKLLSSLPFHQCLVFSNYQIRAQSLCDTLRLKGWPSVFIAGSQTQAQRLKAMERLKQFKCRVLISTDLTSRGIDAENVNVVVNMDVPRDSETYLHRIGRAGRFGTHGVAVTFVAQGDEEKLFKRIEENIGTTIEALPDPIPQSLGAGISGNTTEVDPTMAQPQASSVEVDILKDDYQKQSEAVAVNQDSSYMNKSQQSTESGEKVLVVVKKGVVGKIVCIEDQSSCVADNLTEKESLHKRDQQTVEKFQIEPDVSPSNDSETEEMMNNIQERLQMSLHLDQNRVEENIDGKQLQSVQITCHASELQINETDAAGAVNFQATCEVSSCNDLKESEAKTDHKQSTPFNSSEENSSVAKDSVGKLQFNGNLSSHLESRHSDGTTDELNIDSKESASHCTTQGNKNEPVNGNSSECNEENSPGTQSSDQNFSDSSSDGEEKFDLKFDASEEECGQGFVHSLPSVDEFEKDFEMYLEHVSGNSLEDNAVENCPQPSKLLNDDVDDNENISCDTEDDDYDGTTAKTYAVSEKYNTVPDERYQIFQEDSTRGCYSYYNGLFTEAQHETATGNFGFQENSLSEGHWDHHYPSTDFHDECCQFDNNYFSHYYNSSYYYDQGYFLPHNGHHGVTWAADAQRQTDSASSQQCMGQFCDNPGSYQVYQWNTSWYNAYQRQTSCIRQFVSFSRSVKL